MITREILRIAIPNILSTLSVPLLGIASTFIIACCSGDAAHNIGQLSIGVAIINFIYWNCGCLKMGTTGLTAQAFGAKDSREVSRMLFRSVGIALVLGVILLVTNPLVSSYGVDLMGGGSDATIYVFIRTWSLPAGIIIYALQGWFAGVQNAVIPMVISLVVNISNVVAGLLFAIHLEMNIEGLAYATVVSQWLGVVVGLVLLLIYYRGYIIKLTFIELFQRKVIARFFEINLDVVVKILCIGFVYSFFTAASARMESDLTLAVNSILLQLFTLYSYISDGLADATESLTGRYIGAKDQRSLREVIKRSALFSLIISLSFVVLYTTSWREIITLLINEGNNFEAMLEHASEYIGWIMVIPIVALFPFLMEGILCGSTKTRILRNSTVLSTLLFFAIFYIFLPLMGNDALWLAFSSYMLLRSIMQYLMTDRLRAVYSCAKS